MDGEDSQLLAMTADHAIHAGLLAGPLKDPFDLMLVAQAENFSIVIHKSVFDGHGIRRLW